MMLQRLRRWISQHTCMHVLGDGSLFFNNMVEVTHVRCTLCKKDFITVTEREQY